MPVPVLSLLAMLFTACSPPEPPKKIDGQTKTEQALIDHDYRFSLKRPGKNWQLLGQEGIRRIVPDAVAGLVVSGGPWGGTQAWVSVERHPGGDLKAIANSLVEDMNLEEKRVLGNESCSFHGLDSVKTLVTGKVSGVSFRYASWVFIREGILFRLVVAGLDKATADGKAIDRCQQSLEFSKGKIKFRVRETRIENKQGIGWRVRDNVFTSVVGGLTVHPAPGWRLLVGDELRSMGSDGEVGMALPGRDVYLVVTSKVVPRGFEEAFMDSEECAGLTDRHPDDAKGDIALSVFGSKRQFHETRNEDLTTTHSYHGRWIQAGRYWEVQAWYGEEGWSEIAQQIQAALAGISLADAETSEEITKELEQAQDSPAQLGAGYSLRGGIYRDFELGVTWSKPKRGFWRTKAGPAARAMGDTVRLAATDAQTGLELSVQDISDDVSTAAEAHKAAVASLEQGHSDITVTATESWQLHGISALTTTLDGMKDGLAHRHRITTLHNGKLHLMIGTFALTSLFEGAQTLAIEVERGVAVQQDLVRVKTSKKSHADFHLGYGIRDLPDNASLKDITPDAIRTVGRIIQIRQGRRTLIAFAVHSPGDTQWMIDKLLAMARSNSSIGGIKGEPDTMESMLFLGQPGTRMAWKGWFKSGEIRLTHRNHIFYNVMTSEISAGMDKLIDKIYLID